MAMVIDDLLKVWEDVDQPRVRVVPAFLLYRAPLAETASGIPVLCVARNVACNVRCCFFNHVDRARQPHQICYISGSDFPLG
ncbi:hypothetical protein ACET3Z_004793 [Daucus carota]